MSVNNQRNRSKVAPVRRLARGQIIAVYTATIAFLPASGYAQELYFPPELVASDAQLVADLSRFEKSGAQLPGNYEVEIYINGIQTEQRNVKFIDAGSSVDTGGDNTAEIKDKTGLMPCLTRQDLIGFGVKMDFLPAEGIIADECISPGKYIPKAYTAFNFENMRLDISIPQSAMQTNARGYIPPERWDEGITAALLSYNYSGRTNQTKFGSTNSHYLNLNSGLNVGPWRLRDQRTWNQYQSKDRQYSQWQRVKTYASRTITPLRSEMLLGEGTTSGDIFDSLGFKGLQFATDDSMYPDSMRGFAPVVRGSARTNAEVKIQQNGYTIYQTFVTPGAFVINDLYPVYSSGDLEVIVTEADGSTQSFVMPYSSVPVLQREGNIKYSLTAGRFQSSGDAYSDPQFAQASLIWGLPHNITAYGGMQYSPDYFSGVIGGGLNLGTFGALSMDVTQANSTLADDSQHKGRSLRFLYARSLNTLGTTFQLTGYRYSTKGFHTLDETALKGMKGWRYDNETLDEQGRPVIQPYTDYYNLYNNKRSKVQASISQRVGDMGSIYLSGVRQTYWNSAGGSDSVQAGFNSSIGSVNYNLSYSYNRESTGQGSDRSAYFSFSVPLDAFLSGNRDSGRNTYATYSAGRDKEGNISHQAGLSGTALAGNKLNWGLTQGYTRNEGNSGNLNAAYLGRVGNGSLGYSYSTDYRQVSYGLSGGGILHREGLTLGQSLGETNILIAAPGVSDASVENEIGVSTDRRGYAIKTNASVYRENRVALATDSLDDQTDLDNAVSHVVPTRGAVTKAAFKGHIGSRLLITLTHKGQLLPFGTTATVGERVSIVGDEGLVYLSGVPEKGTLNASWGDGADKRCTAGYQIPSDNKGQQVVKIAAQCR
ncbi:fimbria/pilus outer membrane usher protein [Erwinia billingiae]|uniref:fimbria/pilus outer membrane usher protein n=1 Tax=Erwinia billingiae TaxID=182337 RepID=UPI003BAF5619